MRKTSFPPVLLLLGDIAILWISLITALLLRYGTEDFADLWRLHVPPFALIFTIWICVFYIARLYDLLQLSPKMESATRLWNTLIVNVAIAAVLFYTVPALIITPKILLAIVAVVSALLLTGWRYLMGIIARKSKKLRVCLIGESSEINELIAYINRHPQLGYLIAQHEARINATQLTTLENAFDVVVITTQAREDAALTNALFALLPNGLIVMDFASFYERITGRIPLSHISETWFLENLSEQEKRSFEIGKRAFDVLAGALIAIPTLLITPLIALLIFIESGGPIFYRQERMGRMGRTFWLLKFRTMYKLSADGSAETAGVVWTQKNDTRITLVGRLLRASRIDELPQIWNVLKGDLSFIGPRPERPEFITTLEKNIPFYHMRHLVRPGLSGWAQINPPYYYGTHEESLMKVQYDLFYIKHRSFGLDLSIALKTLAVILSRAGR